MTRSPHGSAEGYADGCVSIGGCPNRDGDLLTCVEAVMRRRSDIQASRLPRGQPVPRGILIDAAVARRSAAALPEQGPVHGTAWGYRRGCRDEQACPNWSRGRVTCAHARRIYLAGYRARRLSGQGTPLEHGTTRGALDGCTDESACPRGANGLTCREARRRDRLDAARRKGVRPRIEPVDAGAHLPLVLALRQAGWSLRRLSREAQCGIETVRRLVVAAEQHRTEIRVLPDTLRALARMADRLDRTTIDGVRGAQ